MDHIYVLQNCYVVFRVTDKEVFFSHDTNQWRNFVYSVETVIILAVFAFYRDAERLQHKSQLNDKLHVGAIHFIWNSFLVN